MQKPNFEVAAHKIRNVWTILSLNLFSECQQKFRIKNRWLKQIAVLMDKEV